MRLWLPGRNKRGTLLVRAFLTLPLLMIAAAPSPADEAYYDPAAPWNEVAREDYPLRRWVSLRRQARAGTAKGRDEFLYINPYLAPDFCARSLTLREKIEQQRGEKFRGDLADQLGGFRDSAYERKIRGTWLERYVGVRALREYLAPLRHPRAIGSRLRQLLAIRKKAERWERVYHGAAGAADEADAFRHFIWVAFMALETGIEPARLVSDRHEIDDVTMDSLMDRYNNAVALAEVERLVRAGARPTDEEVCELAVRMIREGRLVVLASYRGDGGVAASAEDHPDFQRWAHRLLDRRLR